VKSTTNAGEEPDVLDGAQVCYLTTAGRRTRREHTIEIWFTASDRSLYLISGGGAASDWVRNLQSDPAASVRIDDTHLGVRARVPIPEGTERRQAIERLHAKYASRISSTVEDWNADAYIVALDIRAPS
jgi:deazaflavin-dependent oxidoreductase (nitroreductase family)